MATKLNDLQSLANYVGVLEQRVGEKRKIVSCLKNGQVLEVVSPSDNLVVANGLPPKAISVLCEAAQQELTELREQIEGLLGAVTIDAERAPNGWRTK